MRRSLETQLADLAAYRATVAASQAKGNITLPTPQHGVTSVNLLMVRSMLNILPPFLHLGLGLANDCLKEIQKS